MVKTTSDKICPDCGANNVPSFFEGRYYICQCDPNVEKCSECLENEVVEFGLCSECVICAVTIDEVYRIEEVTCLDSYLQCEMTDGSCWLLFQDYEDIEKAAREIIMEDITVYIAEEWAADCFFRGITLEQCVDDIVTQSATEIMGGDLYEIGECNSHFTSKYGEYEYAIGI